MSSVILNPKHRTENSVYMIFSTVIVTFVVLFLDWFPTYSLDANYQLNPFIILMGSSFLATILFYSKIDEDMIHRKLKERSNVISNQTESFILFSLFILQAYQLQTISIKTPQKIINNAIDTTLAGSGLDGEIWKIRGALWIGVSTPFTVLIAYLVFGLNALVVMGCCGIIVIIVLNYSVKRIQNKLKITLLMLAEFLWFDTLLTSVRRSETTSAGGDYAIDVKIRGFSKSLGMTLTEAKPEKESSAKQEISDEILLTLSGTFSEMIPIKRIEKRTRNERLSLECEWLRELVRRGSWASLKVRLADLKDWISLEGAQLREQILPLFMNYWKNVMIQRKISVEFRNYRRLCHLLDKKELLEGVSDIEILRLLLTIDDSHMVKREWGIKYYLYSGDLKRHDLFENIFYKVADAFFSVKEDEYGPGPSHGVEIEIQGLELEYARRTGRSISFLGGISKDEIDNPRKMVYDFD